MAIAYVRQRHGSTVLHAAAANCSSHLFRAAAANDSSHQALKHQSNHARGAPLARRLRRRGAQRGPQHSRCGNGDPGGHCDRPPPQAPKKEPVLVARAMLADGRRSPASEPLAVALARRWTQAIIEHGPQRDAHSHRASRKHCAESWWTAGSSGAAPIRSSGREPALEFEVGLPSSALAPRYGSSLPRCASQPISAPTSLSATTPSSLASSKRTLPLQVRFLALSASTPAS